MAVQKTLQSENVPMYDVTEELGKKKKITY